MGRRGPVPRPMASVTSPLRTTAPAPDGIVPEPPADLSDEARREWGRVVPVLRDMGVLSSADRAALVAYCQTWSECVRISEICESEPPTVRGSMGSMVANPNWMARDRAWTRLLKYISVLGLSPADRARLRVDVPRMRTASGPMAYLTPPAMG